jgi:hypothetical protein
LTDSNNSGEIPSYLQKNGTGRYVCTVCDNTVATLFADLGCDKCSGEPFSENYEEIHSKLEDVLFELETDADLTKTEKERMKGMLEEALEN